VESRTTRAYPAVASQRQRSRPGFCTLLLKGGAQATELRMEAVRLDLSNSAPLNRAGKPLPFLTRDLDLDIAQAADSDETGQAFQSEAGHPFRREAGRGSDLKPATWTVAPGSWWMVQSIASAVKPAWFVVLSSGACAGSRR
jgi:hypothetical protein